MTTQLMEFQQNSLGIWEQQETVQQIKMIYGRDLNNAEFNIFIQLGKATGLNPFLKEMWAVKYGNGAAQIFIGRDGYRKSAQAHPEYDYHLVDAVYSNDNFQVENGEVKHSYSLKDRGDLVGAYCVVKRKGAERPMFTFVELKEYSTNKSLWAKQGGKPATMIKKVAEAQGLRQAFQALFAGTYHEYEDWHEEKPQVRITNKGVQGLKERLGLMSPPSVQDVIERINEAQSPEQLKQAGQAAKDFSDDEKKLLRDAYLLKQQSFKQDNRSNTYA